MNEIFAYRLKSARKMKGFTLQLLAEKLGVSKQMISKYEKGLSVPDSPNLIKLAKILEEKIDYFFRPATFTLKNVSFRKKSKLNKTKIDAIKVLILKQMENYLSIEEILNIPGEFKNSLKSIEINNFDDVEKAAIQLRKSWNLGNDPIHNIISLLEYNKIKVIEIDEPDHKLFDGLSSMVDSKYPVIAINKDFPIERKRFTLLHELAHLLLNINKDLEKDEEKLCNRFAGAMLLPKNIIFEEIGKQRHKISLTELTNFQKQFGISISTIVYRLTDLKVISEYQKTNFYKQQNFDKNFKNICEEVRFSGNESSERFIRLVYKALSQEIISISKASALLDKSIEEIRNQLTVI